MPRPKGSKNKPKNVKVTVDFAAQLAEKQSAKEAAAAEIESITANIDALKADLKTKKAAQDDEAVQAAVKTVAEALGDTGRILVRESGTEPVVRVMVEAPDHDTCQKYVSQVVEAIKNKGYAV